MHIETVPDKQLWICRCAFSEKEIPKNAGFRWNPEQRCWYTKDPAVAAALMTPDKIAELKGQIEQKQVARAEAVELSRAQDADVELPCPEGLAYLPYQRAGIAYSLAHANVLLGDEPGLGKTIETIGVLNADPTLLKILIICPASLRLNWAKELKRWLVREMSIHIVTGKAFHPEYFAITIINYDNLDKHVAKLHAMAWDCIIIDEAHYLKNPKAKRTIAVFGEAQKRGKKPGEIIPAKPELKARRVLALTGTPIPNRPMEGWGLFHYLDSNEFSKFFNYATRYCAASKDGGHWDFSGASHLPELQEKLRASIMIRRLKVDVLTELPAKRRAVIEIPANGDSGVVAAELEAWDSRQEHIAELRAAVELAKASDDPEDYKDAVHQLKDAVSAAFTEMAALRHATAVAKIPYVVEHVKDSLENGKVILFAHHKDVIRAIEGEFGPRAVSVYGDTAMADRQAAVERFQSDPSCDLFIGGILAAGVGLTLTASSHVIFAELDWVPGNMTQAEDRAHRIGQKDMVLVQHLVLEGSLDARMAHILVAKQEVIAAALDNEAAGPALPIAAKEHAATESISREKVEKAAKAITPEQIAAVHRGLQVIAGMCDDARSIDGAGFSKIDVRIGHDLAEAWSLTPQQAVLGAKLCTKYRRQLPVELAEEIAKI